MDAPRVRAAIHRAFVEYNPLYFASALCVLAGAFLLMRGLPPEAFPSKLGVVGGIEVYQFLLIAAAAVLLRAGLRRPAAILGLACLVFMLDVAMNSERLLSHVGLLSLAPGMRARKAVPASIVLALLGPVKIALLAHVFQLRRARGPLIISGLALLALPLLPYLTELVHSTQREGVYLLTFWLGAPLLAWACSPGARRWTSGRVDDDQEPRLRNIVAVAPLVVSGLFIAHGLTWSVIATLTPTWAQAAPYVLVVTGLAAARLASRRPRTAEFLAWAGTGCTLWATRFAEATTGLWPLAIQCIAAGGLLVWLVEAKGLRLFLLATVCLFAGAYVAAAGTTPPLPLPGPAWPAALAVALLAGAIRHRDFRCLFVSALAAGILVASLRPGAGLLSYGGLVAGLWLAVFCWFVFPSLRRWVPFAAAVAVLLLGAWMLWRESPHITPCYAGIAVAAGAVGLVTRRLEFQGAAAAGGAVLAGFKRGSWIPETSIGWGLVLLGAGFVLLTAGVLVNLQISRRRPRVQHP